MNAKIAIEMQNVFGRFIQYYHLNCLELAEELFAENARLWLPDRGIDAMGRENIVKVLLAMQQERVAKGVRRDVHVPHTPAYDTWENDTVGVATWDVHSYAFSAASTDRHEVEYIYARIDAKFAEEDGQWKFTELDWWDVESFLPATYHAEADDGVYDDMSAFCIPPEYRGTTSVRDFYAIQNVVTRFAQNNRKYAMEDTFASTADVSYRALPFCHETARGHKAVEKALKYLDELEEKNVGKYVYVPTTSCPVIEVADDGIHARAQWMASYYTFVGEAFGVEENPYRFVRRIGLLRASFLKEESGWRVVDYDASVLMALPFSEYDATTYLEHCGTDRNYQRMGMEENRWKFALPKMGGDFPEDMPYLESLPAHWVNAYRTGTYPEFFEKHMFNDEHENFFHSRGRGRDASAIIGTKKMLEFFSLGAFHYHHQQITNHGGMSPDIEISMDGRWATVTMFDFNSTPWDTKRANDYTIDVPDDWSQETSGYEHTPCRHQLSMYQFSMAKVEGEWKIISVDWETLAVLADLYLAGKTSRGWAGCVTDFKYPRLFEKYQYSAVRKVPDKETSDC